MFYILQQNVFKEHHFELLIEWLDKTGTEYEIIEFKHFVENIEFTTKRKDVWCWGSVSMARHAFKYNWTPGSMYNKNHDFEVYGKEYGKYMLNHDSHVMKFGDELPSKFEYFFARPTQDTKAFTGRCFSRPAWNESIEETKKPWNGISRKPLLDLDTQVMIAPLRNIEQEVRCWVVKGKVVTASRYAIGGRVVYQNYDDETFYTDFAQKMVDIYQPAEAFVIDVCLSDGELKVVETNCINSSGYYHANIDKLMEAIETNF